MNTTKFHEHNFYAVPTKYTYAFCLVLVETFTIFLNNFV